MKVEMLVTTNWGGNLLNVGVTRIVDNVIGTRWVKNGIAREVPVKKPQEQPLNNETGGADQKDAENKQDKKE